MHSFAASEGIILWTPEYCIHVFRSFSSYNLPLVIDVQVRKGPFLEKLECECLNGQPFCVCVLLDTVISRRMCIELYLPPKTRVTLDHREAESAAASQTTE